MAARSQRHTLLEELVHISTPFRPDKWERELKACRNDVWDEYGSVVAGMREGFKTGVENVKLSQTYIAGNMVKPKLEEWLTAEYDKETTLGRLSEGFMAKLVEEHIGTWTAALAWIRF